MKILFYIGQLGGGGAERVISIISDGLIKMGHEVYIITKKYSELDYTFNKNIHISVIDDFKYGSMEIYNQSLKHLRDMVISIQPDVMVGVIHHSFYELWDATKELGIPIIASDHNNFQKKSNLKINYIRNYYYNYADATAILTKTDYEFMKSKLNNMKVINNPLSFPILEEEIEKEKTVLCCGRLNAWSTKGFDLILQIWSMIAKKHPGWRLKIAGTGKEENLDFLKGVAELENVKDSVDFLGFRKDIKEIMSRSSIFALPSREEGFPCVLLEAMSQGCAPVAFEIRGNINEIITDGQDGFLIPDGNLKMFAEKLDELMNKEDLRKKFRENARISLKRFEPEKIVDQWVEMFQEVIKKKKTDV